MQDVLNGFVNLSFQFNAGMSSTSLPGCVNQVPRWILYEKDVKHLDWLQFHLPILYKVVGSSLQDMHLCSSLDAVCMICGEFKAPHVRPRGYTPALTDIKAKGCTVNDPNVDVDGFASILTAFVNSGKFSAT